MNVIKVVFFCLFLFSGFRAFCQIDISTANPEISVVFDVTSTSKGLLIPHVELNANLASPCPVSNPATGLLIYNSDINQEQPFYYNISKIKTPCVSSSFLAELDANDDIGQVTNGQTNLGALTITPNEKVFFIGLLQELET